MQNTSIPQNNKRSNCVSGRMPHCHNCDTALETTEDLEADEIQTIDTENQDDGPPKIHIGKETADVWRCSGCGSVYGSRS